MPNQSKNPEVAQILKEQTMLTKAEKHIQSLIDKINVHLNELLVS